MSKENEMRASSDKKAISLYKSGLEPLCPKCGDRAFPTNFSPADMGGSGRSRKVVWLCSDMGHCAFSIDTTIKWKPKENEK